MQQLLALRRCPMKITVDQSPFIKPRSHFIKILRPQQHEKTPDETKSSAASQIRIVQIWYCQQLRSFILSSLIFSNHDLTKIGTQNSYFRRNVTCQTIKALNISEPPKIHDLTVVSDLMIFCENSTIRNFLKVLITRIFRFGYIFIACAELRKIILR